MKGAVFAAPFIFDAYLPLPFLEGFASFLAFFAMAGSCGLSSRGCVDADAHSFVGIRALRKRVKMNSRFETATATFFFGRRPHDGGTNEG
jgi:hypothetical protein